MLRCGLPGGLHSETRVEKAFPWKERFEIAKSGLKNTTRVEKKILSHVKETRLQKISHCKET